jgi:hypothetical protein
MLEAVIQNVRVHLEAFFRRLAGTKTIGAQDDGDAGKHASQQRRLIANLSRLGRAGGARLNDDQILLVLSAIPSRENAGLQTLAL